MNCGQGSNYLWKLRRGWLAPKMARNCTKAVDDLLPRLYLFEKLMIMSTKKDRIFTLHFDPGLLIRNRYGLWRGNDKLILAACGYPCHPDEASMPIIEGVWQALHNCLRCLLPKSPRGGND
jgi:hypothetical protein